MLWLRADMGITLGTGVSAWADQSGNGNSPTQATGSSQPTLVQSAIGGQPALSFNGTSEYMITPSALTAAPMTIFAVGQTATQSVEHAMMADISGTYNYIYSFNPNFIVANSGGSQFSKSPTDTTIPHVYGVTINGAASGLYVDGVKTTGTLGASAASRQLFGAYPGPTVYWDKYIAEVIFYTSVLSAANISQVGKYLASRYGIAGSW